MRAAAKLEQPKERPILFSGPMVRAILDGRKTHAEGPVSASHRLATSPSKCRSCEMDILWVVWPASGKRMPVDAEPSSEGDILLTLRKSENVLMAARVGALSEELLPGRKRYRSHFSTCPAADHHRKTK